LHRALAGPGRRANPKVRNAPRVWARGISCAAARSHGSTERRNRPAHSAAAEFLVNGFSTKICLLFSKALLASEKRWETGVTMATASICGSVRISGGSVVPDIAGKLARTRSRDLGLRSQTETTTAFGVLGKLRTKLGPQYPYPMTPIFNDQTELPQFIFQHPWAEKSVFNKPRGRQPWHTEF
jgi:hypothetical protein